MDFLSEVDSFSASQLSDVMSGNQDVFKTLAISDKDDQAVVRFVCGALSERCGFLVAVPLAVFVDRMKAKDHVAIAVTGSLYKYHPDVKNLMEKYIAKMSPGRNFHTFLSDDGSGKGAGLVAAIAARLKASES